jgi:hypothetical protein
VEASVVTKAQKDTIAENLESKYPDFTPEQIRTGVDQIIEMAEAAAAPAPEKTREQLLVEDIVKEYNKVV